MIFKLQNDALPLALNELTQLKYENDVENASAKRGCV